MGKSIIGIGSTTGGLGGYTPQVNRTGFVELREKRLFFSQRESGLFLMKTVRGGYGEIPAGTVLAEDTNSGFLIPYVPDTIAATDKGRLMLVTGCNATDTFQIWKEDSGKVKVGDVIVLTDTDGTYEEATVSAVATVNDRISSVTLGGNTTGNFELAKSACCYLKAGASGKRSTAKYVLDQDTFAGEYDNPNGAQVSVFVSNGILYGASLVGHDSTAATALGSTTDGQFVIIK